jgi:DNA invertase Pin-like site-specific DNA recombinase
VKAVAYIRVSTEGQASEGVSLEAQQAKVRAWCLANDCDPPETFIDAGISGSRADNRPELQHALEAVIQSKGVLVVYSLSRLARSTKDTILISERLDKAGCDLVSLSEKIDTTSAAGKMVFRMLAVMAEFERDLISERTTAALAHKKAQGKRVGGIPFGFDLASDGETLVRNPDEQDSLTFIRDLRNEGRSLRSIASALEARGIATKSGKHQWSAKVVRGVLART